MLLFYLFSENKTFIMLYNKKYQKCLNTVTPTLTLGPCKSDDCKAKWSWNNKSQLTSAIDLNNCISVDKLSSGSKTNLNTCVSNMARRWQCDGDRLVVQGAKTKMFFSSKKDSNDLLLVTTKPDAWINYFTGKDLCSEDKKGRSV